jgi:peptidyl-tRNA hydrolase
MERLYVVTRQDLPDGPQAVQSCHAVVAFAIEHRECLERWAMGSNTLVLVSVRNEDELRSLASSAEDAGILTSRFHEPDLGGSLTSVVMDPRAKRLCRSLPKTLHGRAEDSLKHP